MILSASRIAKGRRGVSLTEALIALGILTIGLISLLSLFPVGAVRMAQAVRDDRVAMLGANGDAFFRQVWRKTTLNPTGSPETLMLRSSINSATPWTTRLDDNTVRPPVAVDAVTASWPLMLDPAGLLLNGAWAGNDTGNAVGWLRREDHIPKYLGVPTTAKEIVRLNYTTDDLTFTASGDPYRLASSEVERQDRYSYAWIIQRPNNSIHEEVRLLILTFQNRAPSITKSKEEAYEILSFSGTGVRIRTAGPSPIFRKGQWVIACHSPTVAASATVAGPFASPYRVLNLVQDPSLPTEWEVEFQQPIPNGPPNVQNSASLRLIAFESLVEVFDRGILSPTSAPGYSNGK